MYSTGDETSGRPGWRGKFCLGGDIEEVNSVGELSGSCWGKDTTSVCWVILWRYGVNCWKIPQLLLESISELLGESVSSPTETDSPSSSEYIRTAGGICLCWGWACKDSSAEIFPWILLCGELSCWNNSMEVTLWGYFHEIGSVGMILWRFAGYRTCWGFQSPRVFSKCWISDSKPCGKDHFGFQFCYCPYVFITRLSEEDDKIAICCLNRVGNANWYCLVSRRSNGT